MDRRVFEAALRAATKITFGTTLLGCGSNVVFQVDEETEQALGGADSSPALGSGAAAQAGGGGAGVGGETGEGGAIEVASCAVPPEPARGWGVYDRATFDCCAVRIDEQAPAAVPSADWAYALPRDPAIDNCCTQLLTENYQSIWSGEPLVHAAPEKVIAACCVHSFGDVGCSPWGPPVPVAMDPAEYVPWVMDAQGERPMRAPNLGGVA